MTRRTLFRRAIAGLAALVAAPYLGKLAAERGPWDGLYVATESGVIAVTPDSPVLVGSVSDWTWIALHPVRHCVRGQFGGTP